MNFLKLSGKTLSVSCSFAIGFSACTVDPNSPGVEYMPDMYRSPAIEAYVDYGMDPYFVGEEKSVLQRNTPSARVAIIGTIPYKGNRPEDLQTAFPYALKNTPEDYLLAATAITNPLVLNKVNFEAGQRIYSRMCIHCHGEKGAGDGSMTETAGGKYPVVPTYQSRKGLSQGQMYHTLQYGKGLMGSHASQLSQYERWQVVHYVTALMNDSIPDFEIKVSVDIAALVQPTDTITNETH